MIRRDIEPSFARPATSKQKVEAERAEAAATSDKWHPRIRNADRSLQMSELGQTRECNGGKFLPDRALTEPENVDVLST